MRGEGGSEIQSLPKSMMRRFMDEKEDKVVKLKIEIFKFYIFPFFSYFFNAKIIEDSFLFFFFQILTSHSTRTSAKRRNVEAMVTGSSLRVPSVG